jgi:hypothetical protein
MKRLFSVAAVALSFLAGGCAIHPLPEDVTGVDTYHIVRQIRCETREALRQLVIAWLSDPRLNNDYLNDLAFQYQNHPESISNFHYDLFKGPDLVQVRSVAKLFYDTGIAYNFDLTMTEDNDLSTDLSLLKPFTEPKFTLGIHAEAKRRRANNRSFTLTDTFSYLLTKLNVEVRGQRYCDGQIVQANYIYPIAGRIGVDKIVKDFIKLTLFGNLAGKAAEGPPTMAEKLTFTTSVSGSANPLVVFTPVTHAFQLTTASLTGGAGRSDIHGVTVGLAIAPSGRSELEPFRSFLFSSSRGTPVARQAAEPRNASTLYVGSRVTGGGTPAERLAVVTIDQVKSREIQLIAPQ